MAGEEALAQAIERPSSPAAGSEESAANGAVGGRVQRLVRLLVGDLRAELRTRGHESKRPKGNLTRTKPKTKTTRPTSATGNKKLRPQVLEGTPQSQAETSRAQETLQRRAVNCPLQAKRRAREKQHEATKAARKYLKARAPMKRANAETKTNR